MTAAAFARRGPARERTDQPVWRGSYDENDPRAQVVLPFAGNRVEALTFINHYLRGLERLANELKQRGKAHDLTQNALYVARTVLRECTDFGSGRCVPSIERIMEKTRLARPTVVHLLAVLRKLAGFDWVRRTVRTGNAPGAGPLVKQTSNAYFIDLARVPKQVMLHLRQMLGAKVDTLPRQKGSPLLPAFRERLTARLVKGVSAARSAVLGTGRRDGDWVARRQAEIAREWQAELDREHAGSSSEAVARGLGASSETALQWVVKEERQKE